MKEFAEMIRDIPVEKCPALIFMGQAGFIIKDRDGLLYAVDVYLSDCCEREFGFKRLMPKLLEPDELVFDFILTTHAHYDHFDIDAIPRMMENGRTRLFTTSGGMEEGRKLGIDKNAGLIEEGGRYVIGGVTLTAVFCDHGELAPDAVGFLIELYGKKILLCGDTAFRPEKISYLRDENIDWLFVPINGAFGNLNEREAVEYVKILQPKTAVPCHYGNFREHGGDVALFSELFDKSVSGVNKLILGIGDTIFL
ncbi:MAG: MBL fold metallo-hydrolase [Clostridia bacterium]|nr:MBL fold metallo-hydrolase [Clostridia bacterium]